MSNDIKLPEIHENQRGKIMGYEDKMLIKTY